MSTLAQQSHSHIKSQNYALLQAYNWHTPGDGHWRKLTERLDDLSDMGITAIWVPPPTKACNKDSVGFDVYDIWDMGEFDQKGSVPTKYGTKEELKTLIREAKKRGIVTYIDAVLNHKAGADEEETFKVKAVDENDRTKFISDEYEAKGWTKFNFPGRQDKYSKMHWHSHHFTGIDYDSKNDKKGIFKIMGQNKDWGQADDTLGNYDYLMFSDIDLNHPEVVEDMKNWGKWVTDELDIAGFRFDAVRHMDEKFMSNFMKTVRKGTGKDLFGVGEFFTEDLESLIGYLERFGTQFSVFDTPLHYNFQQAGDKTKDYDLRKIFDGSLVQARSTDAVTFVDNHDTQPGQTLDSFVNPQFKPLAYALILLRHPGYPCVFDGDLFGILEGEKRDPVTQLGDIIKCRKWFTYGETRDYWDHPNTIGWVRVGDEEHDGCAVVLSNGDEGKKAMEVGKEHAGEVWTDVLGWHQGEITIRDDGWADFLCPGMSISVWAKNDARGREHFKR